MKKFLSILFVAVALASSCCGPKDGEYTFRILTTNDVHGRYFDAEYVNDGVRNSLISAAWYIDSVRVAAGKENVILVDVGDKLLIQPAFVSSKGNHFLIIESVVFSLDPFAAIKNGTNK